MRITLVINVFLLILLCPACVNLGPDYERPQVELSDRWDTVIRKDQEKAFTGSQRWWKMFQDPTLNQLLTLARKRNLDIQAASLRVQEAWYQRSIVATTGVPKVNLSGSGLQEFSHQRQNFTKRWESAASHDAQLNTNVSWELDVFGRIKRMKEVSQAEYEYQIEDKRDIQVLIDAEVVELYIDYQMLRFFIQATQEAIDVFKKMHHMIKMRQSAGFASELDVAEALRSLQTQEARMPTFLNQRYSVQVRLANLLRVPIKEVSRTLEKSKDYQMLEFANDVIPKSPVELLRSRPDIRKAERSVAAQSARIGIAKSELYPQFSLGGTLSFDFLHPSSSLSLLRTASNFGPSFSWKVFQSKADKHRVKLQQVALEREIVLYKRTVFNAMTEVEISLNNIKHTKQRYDILRSSTGNLEKAVGLMEEAYLENLVSVERFLDLQTDYINSRNDFYATQNDLARHYVALFRALGGGFLNFEHK